MEKITEELKQEIIETLDALVGRLLGEGYEMEIDYESIDGRRVADLGGFSDSDITEANQKAYEEFQERFDYSYNEWLEESEAGYGEAKAEILELAREYLNAVEV